MQHEVVNPLLHDLSGFGFDQGSELFQLGGLEGRAAWLRHEVDADHAALNNSQLGATLAALALSMNVHRLVLVAIEENIQPEVFIQLRHLLRNDVGAEGPGARRIG